MAVSDRLGLTEAQELGLTRLLQVVLVGLAAFGLVAGSSSTVVNALGSLAVTFLPAVLRREVGLRVDVGLVLWLTVAAVLHTIGILGPYQNVWWWDYLTHTLSAAVVTGAGYAVVHGLDEHADGLHIPEPVLSLVLFVYIVAFGVLWELLEMGTSTVTTQFLQRSPLVVYGLQDVVTDLLFTTVGGIVVIVWARRYFRDLSGKVARVFARS